MTEDIKDLTDSENKENDKQKDKKSRNKPLTKVVIRRLPPTMDEAAFLNQVSPIPEHDYFYFAKPDLSLEQCAFSRAYINFVNVDDLLMFQEKFDGYVFVDEKGVEYTGIVELAPFQRIPKKRKKKDPKCGTIESDPLYQEFIESLNVKDNEGPETKLELNYQFNEKNDKKNQSTPLLDYIVARKQDRKAREERRRREAERRKFIRLDKKMKDTTIKEESPERDSKKAKSKDADKEKSQNENQDKERNKEKEKHSKDTKDFSKNKETKDSAKAKETKKSEESKPVFKDNIKPFTKLPQVKPDNNIMSKIKSEEKSKAKEKCKDIETSDLNKGERASEEKSVCKEDTSEKEKGDGSGDSRSERRIRNKDRPSLVIYQPGMGKYSKQRIKEKDPKSGNETPDT